MQIFIVFVLLAIMIALGAAFFFLMRDRGTTSRTVQVLAIRVGLSMFLFLTVLLAYSMGWITPTGWR